jgi:hypothetical protein
MKSMELQEKRKCMWWPGWTENVAIYNMLGTTGIASAKTFRMH